MDPILLLILSNIFMVIVGSMFGIGAYVMYRLDLKWKKEEKELEQIHSFYDSYRAEDDKRDS